MEPIIIIGGIAALIGLVAVIILFNFGATWLRAFMSGAKVTIFQLVTLQLQKIPIRRIVDPRITAVRSGINVSIEDLSAHHLLAAKLKW